MNFSREKVNKINMCERNVNVIHLLYLYPFTLVHKIQNKEVNIELAQMQPEIKNREADSNTRQNVNKCEMCEHICYADLILVHIVHTHL